LLGKASMMVPVLVRLVYVSGLLKSRLEVVYPRLDFIAGAINLFLAFLSYVDKHNFSFRLLSENYW
jgi:hypothetical protein